MAPFSPANTSRYWLIVPAAGIGARMNADVPKQYLPLSGKTVIEHTLTRLLQLPYIQQCVVALHAQDRIWKSLAVSEETRITTVQGGGERSDSVLNALQSLTFADHNDWVLVHDAARPCIALSSVNDLCAAVHDHAVGGILGVPVSDTLKSVDPKQQIISTVDRRHLWQAQTPQMFRYGVLRRSLESAAQNGKSITDEASAVEACGHSAIMVAGRSDNIKITRPEDLLFAQWILQQQEQP